MPDPLPRQYASFHDVTDNRIFVLKNDLGEKLTVTREAAGDMAIMLAEFCDDSDLAEFVAAEWRGRADVLEEDEEEPDYGEEMTHLLNTEAKRVDLDDQAMVDLGGGMVVPLSELMEDDEP